ncbi:MAG: hypothetical protein AB7G47_16830 [Mycolicibacterium sp.]|uniref:hypothetical protein n=1 Tax=Mycolicibacterium sp. TaxID=2320850 RepID=UPI003D14F0E5
MFNLAAGHAASKVTMSMLSRPTVAVRLGVKIRVVDSIATIGPNLGGGRGGGRDFSIAHGVANESTGQPGRDPPLPVEPAEFGAIARHRGTGHHMVAIGSVRHDLAAGTGQWPLLPELPSTGATQEQEVQRHPLLAGMFSFRPTAARWTDAG